MKIYVDEAGRWPLAWPLYCGLILVLDENFDISDYKDSKILKESKREELFEKINQWESDKTYFTAIWTSSNKEIDKYGVSRALSLAVSRGVWTLMQKLYTYIIQPQLWTVLCSCDRLDNFALQDLVNKKEYEYNDIKELLLKFGEIILSSSRNEVTKDIANYTLRSAQGWQLWLEAATPIQIIIDGNRKFDLDKDLWVTVEPIIDGDDLVPYISMASILAKVARDREMIELSNKYKKYGFEKHKWYGTKLHKEMLEKHWICPIHRKLFLKWSFPEHKIRPFDKRII